MVSDTSLCLQQGFDLAVAELAGKHHRIAVSVLAGVESGEHLLLGGVVDVRDAGPALEHPPTGTALDAEQHHLA
jgi:hypothetical protein